ncbi:MAG: RHS repeat-associated core domain-containing protein, partial [Syntrophales bacterium]
MTSKNGTAIAYDYDNRPTSIGASTFVYDYAGQRVKKNGTVYIGNIYECTGGVCTKYIFAGGTRIAMKSGSTVNYYHTDHLGSSSIVTNASGTKVEEIYYYPYGATRSNSGSVNVKHKYTGQEEDAETGLYYYGARYYDPSIGRFISADTIVPNPSYPQSLNRYSYGYNNPIIYTDPNGHNPFVIGFIIGALIAGIQSDWDFEAMVVGGVIGGISGGVFAEASSLTQTALGGVVQSGTSGGMISGMVGGGAAGATAGGLSAAYYGGNIGDAMLRGAGLGAAGGAAFGAIGVPNSFGKVAAYTLTGGGLSELGGGDFRDGAIFAGVTAFAAYGYNKITGFNARWEKGEGYQQKGRFTLPNDPTLCHIGIQGAALTGNFWNDFLLEGGWLSRTTNYIAGFNATGVQHDVLQIKLDELFGGQGMGDFMRSTLNIPNMIPAAALTYAGLLADPRALILLSVDPTKDR